ATDFEDGDLTDMIAVIGEVDTMNGGEYTLIYIVEDSGRNRIEYVRRVTVNYNKSDVNKDNKIDILDLALVAQSYNKISSDLDWNQALDINNDGIIVIFDIVLVSNKTK
ncbi:DUF5011 domain-containing protein, partial [Clostridium perfringens]|uniref:immunoglobulin-like domain-containing protein n=1 Tax=Clostridium perfringens TaxID=1502 RepID=UPI002AC51B65